MLRLREFWPRPREFSLSLTSNVRLRPRSGAFGLVNTSANKPSWQNLRGGTAELFNIVHSPTVLRMSLVVFPSDAVTLVTVKLLTGLLVGSSLPPAVLEASASQPRRDVGLGVPPAVVEATPVSTLVTRSPAVVDCNAGWVGTAVAGSLALMFVVCPATPGDDVLVAAGSTDVMTFWSAWVGLVVAWAAESWTGLLPPVCASVVAETSSAVSVVPADTH